LIEPHWTTAQASPYKDIAADPVLESIPPMKLSSRAEGYVFALAAPLCWSFGGVIIRTVEAGPWDIVFWRAAGHLLFFPFLLAFLLRVPIVGSLQAGGRTTLVSGLMVTGMFSLHVLAMTSTSVANALLLQSTSPILVAILGWLALRERVSLTSWIAIAVAFSGLAVVMGGGLADGAMFGKAMALGVAICSAVNVLLVRAYPTLDLRPATLLGAAASMGLGFAFSEVLAVDLGSIAALIFLGMLQMSVGLAFFFAALKRLPPVEVALITLLEPVLGPIWTWLAVGEVPASSTIHGGAILLAALAFNTFAGARAKPSP
jgi:drug/metabolite transporter (DMT)-like permease